MRPGRGRGSVASLVRSNRDAFTITREDVEWPLTPSLPGGEEGSSAALSPIPSVSTRRRAGCGVPSPRGREKGEGEGRLLLSGTRRFGWRGSLFPFAHRPAVIRQRMPCALLQRPPNCVADGHFLAPQAGVPAAKRLDAARFQLSTARKRAGLRSVSSPSPRPSPLGRGRIPAALLPIRSASTRSSAECGVPSP